VGAMGGGRQQLQVCHDRFFSYCHFDISLDLYAYLTQWMGSSIVMYLGGVRGLKTGFGLMTGYIAHIFNL
jgi:hypothetical protein